MNSIFNSENNGEINNLSNENFTTLQKARKDLIGEIQAIIDYDEHIYSSTNQAAIHTWEHIRNEELNHVGELLALLNVLAPYQRNYVESGIKEFMEMQNL